MFRLCSYLVAGFVFLVSFLLAGAATQWVIGWVLVALLTAVVGPESPP